MKKLIVSLWLALAGLTFLSAEESAAPAGQPAKFTTDFGFVIATTLEAKATLTEHLAIPVFTGEGLFSGNNLELKLAEELSPVSANLGFEAVLTPVAFLQFNAGVMIGSGWNFLGIANGLGINAPLNDGSHNSAISADPFRALMYKCKFGGVFQFDLAALLPGDWNHIVARSYHEFNYRGLAGVSDSASWQYEADAGENRNGWNYYGNYPIGYQMPVFLQTVALLLETDKSLYNTPGGTVWGEDQMRLNFGPILNFQFTGQISLALIVQLKTARVNTAATQMVDDGSGNRRYTWYQDRVLDAANPQTIVWNRAALSLNLQF